MVQLVRVTNKQDLELLKVLISKHVRLTGSRHGQAVLDQWIMSLNLFWKVAPKGTVGSTAVRPPPVEQSQQVVKLSQHVVG